MRVEVNTVGEFARELRASSGDVVGGYVRIRRDVSPEQEEDVTRSVSLWATALVDQDGCRWVLELGLSLGSERTDGKDDRRASRLANEAESAILAAAEDCRLGLRDGKWELY